MHRFVSLNTKVIFLFAAKACLPSLIKAYQAGLGIQSIEELLFLFLYEGDIQFRTSLELVVPSFNLVLIAERQISLQLESSFSYNCVCDKQLIGD